MSRLFARIGLRSAVVVLSVVLTVLVLAVAILPRPSAAGDGHPMNVRGYVYNNVGLKIANADVTVTMYNVTPGVSKTDTTSSSPLGYFSVDFEIGEWATGETILVVVVYQGVLQGYNDTAVANGINMYTWENFTSPYEISQLGNTTGLLLTAGLVGVVAAVGVVWIRKVK
jgi:hypothetical protein